MSSKIFSSQIVTSPTIKRVDKGLITGNEIKAGNTLNITPIK